MHISLSVALNYQTSGLMMDLNDGKYMRNGGCGYVLKPAIMREQIAYFSANTRDVIPGVSPQILHVKVTVLSLKCISGEGGLKEEFQSLIITETKYVI